MRAFWGIALGAVAAVLAATGSLQVIQTASIATAFPLMFLLLLVLYGTFKGLNEYRLMHTSTQKQAPSVPE
jgi:choline/glycine/proline betaine transport protein/glycine betaine transporter